jgi:pyridoxine 5-phosphate synthase
MPYDMAINLSVNLNKIALLRNSRGAQNPAPLVAAQACIDAGVQGLTLHWREDNRHTRKEDVYELCALAKDKGVEFNLEGDSAKNSSHSLWKFDRPSSPWFPSRPARSPATMVGSFPSSEMWWLPSWRKSMRREFAVPSSWTPTPTT